MNNYYEDSYKQGYMNYYRIENMFYMQRQRMFVCSMIKEEENGNLELLNQGLKRV